MTLNEIFANKVAKDVADNKSVTDIISSTKRIIQIQFCSRNNKGQISESGMNRAISKLDEWAKLPEEKALSAITCQIQMADNVIERKRSRNKARNKEECLKATRLATQSMENAG